MTINCDSGTSESYRQFYLICGLFYSVLQRCKKSGANCIFLNVVTVRTWDTRTLGTLFTIGPKVCIWDARIFIYRISLNSFLPWIVSPLFSKLVSFIDFLPRLFPLSCPDFWWLCSVLSNYKVLNFEPKNSVSRGCTVLYFS